MSGSVWVSSRLLLSPENEQQLAGDRYEHLSTSASSEALPHFHRGVRIASSPRHSLLDAHAVANGMYQILVDDVNVPRRSYNQQHTTHMHIELCQAMGLPTYLLDDYLDIDVDCPGAALSDAERNARITSPAMPPFEELAAKLFESYLQDVETPEPLIEFNPHSANHRVYLVVLGRLRIVAYCDRVGAVEVGQCDAGQWIGLPNALREHDNLDKLNRWADARIIIKAIPIGPVRLKSIPVGDVIMAMRTCAPLAQRIRQIIAARFAHRTRFLTQFAQNPILRLLSSSDQEYLLQSATLRRHQQTGRVKYMVAGAPSKWIALLLRGECTLTLGSNRDEMAGVLQAPTLIGIDTLMSTAELQTGDVTAHLAYVPRQTTLFLAPNAEILEFEWACFRNVLARFPPVWRSVARKIDSGCFASKLPELVFIQSSRRYLGLSTLVDGAAAALAIRHARTVCIVDLQGAERFKLHYEPRGFGVQRVVLDRVKDEATDCSFKYCQLSPPSAESTSYDIQAGIEVVWPCDPARARHVETIVEALMQRDDLDVILVCARLDEENPASAGKELAARLNHRSSRVLYVTDTPEMGYQFDGFVPNKIVWVERLSARYLGLEKMRLRQLLNASRSQTYMRWLPSIFSEKKKVLGAASATEPSRSREVETPRRIVRVPTDSAGALENAAVGPAALLKNNRVDTALGRAFARLARVITRQTVGLALGGGGAWGYSHVALIQHLEERGIPIDYIAGSSFGATIGGLYAAGGLEALHRLIEENSTDPDDPNSTLLSILARPLMRATLLAPISTYFIKQFIDEHLARMGVNGGESMSLGMTEIPFYPVASDLLTLREFVDEHGTIGFGVRMSSTMPPAAPALHECGRRIVDGAFVAIVPSRYLREMGVDFIIAALSVPPTPHDAEPTDFWGSLVNRFGTRFYDAVWANQLLMWRAGQDHATLYADCVVDFRPRNVGVFGMWKGREIVKQIHEAHFGDGDPSLVQQRWEAHIIRSQHTPYNPENCCNHFDTR